MVNNEEHVGRAIGCLDSIQMGLNPTNLQVEANTSKTSITIVVAVKSNEAGTPFILANGQESFARYL